MVLVVAEEKTGWAWVDKMCLVLRPCLDQCRCLYPSRCQNQFRHPFPDRSRYRLILRLRQLK